MNALSRITLDLTSALVGIATQQQRIHVCSRRFYSSDLSGKPMQAITVLVDGEVYEVDQRDYERLLAGWTPDELELSPVEEDA